MSTSTKKNLTTITIISTFGGLLFGYDTGVINGALPYMMRPDQLNLTPATEGLVASAILFGAAIGAVAGGHLSDKNGRRSNILLLAMIFFIAAIGCALAPSAEVMVAFRFLLGLAVGGASVTVPTYLAEMSPVADRGRIVTQNELMIVSGQFIAFVLNAVIGVYLGHVGGHIWRYMLVIASLPAVVLWFGMLVMPESPRWLVSKGQMDKALKVLQKVREEKQAQKELKEIEELVEAEAHMDKATLKDLSIPWVRRIVLLGVGLGIIQQLTGINTIMYYGTQILQNSGFSTESALVGNTANGLIAILSTLMGMWFIGKRGRRPLLIIGQAGVIVSLFLIGTFSMTMQGSPLLPYVVLGLTVIFLIFMAGLIAPVVWLMLSEIFPLRLRGLGMGISVFCLWITNFFIGLSFPVLLAGIGLSTTFFAFAVVNILSLVFVLKYVPETKGRSLEQLEEYFRSQDGKATV
ncbi:MAG TPA: sugar porter family MFS transporter [Negativicutes bacterium]